MIRTALVVLLACAIGLGLSLTGCYSGINVPKDAIHSAHLKALNPRGVLDGLPGLGDYTLRVVDCGFDNAFTEPSEKEILMCADLSAHGLGFERAVLLHEAGHAAFRSGVHFTGLEELAADEYAIYWSIRSGRREDVAAFALYWATTWDTQDDGQDPHPSGLRRWAYSECLYKGSGPAPAGVFEIENWYECRAEWKRVRAYWDAELTRA